VLLEYFPPQKSPSPAFPNDLRVDTGRRRSAVHQVRHIPSVRVRAEMPRMQTRRRTARATRVRLRRQAGRPGVQYPRAMRPPCTGEARPHDIYAADRPDRATDGRPAAGGLCYMPRPFRDSGKIVPLSISLSLGNLRGPRTPLLRSTAEVARRKRRSGLGLPSGGRRLPRERGRVSGGRIQ
jgi:hypothetical protein